MQLSRLKEDAIIIIAMVRKLQQSCTATVGSYNLLITLRTVSNHAHSLCLSVASYSYNLLVNVISYHSTVLSNENICYAAICSCTHA